MGEIMLLPVLKSLERHSIPWYEEEEEEEEGESITVAEDHGRCFLILLALAA